MRARAWCLRRRAAGASDGWFLPIGLPRESCGASNRWRTEQASRTVSVARKALDASKPHEAERLLASVVADCQAFAERATTVDELVIVARMHDVLAPILRPLEAMTGKPWTRCLAIIKADGLAASGLSRWKSRLPPRGKA